jgi:hypothetical protein
MEEGIEEGGAVGQAGEQRRLGQVELGGVDAEVGARRRLAAVGAVTVVDGVEVLLEDP